MRISSKTWKLVFICALAAGLLIFSWLRKPPLVKYREAKVLGNISVAIDVCMDKGADSKKIAVFIDDVWQRLREVEPETGAVAIDGAVDILRKRGIRHFLIGTDEDVYASGQNCARRPWSIAIRDPWTKQIVDIVAVSNMSVSNFLDPKTSMGATVLAPKVRDGRLLARRICSMPAAKAAAAVNEQGRHYAGILISKDGQGRVHLTQSAEYTKFKIRKSK